MQAATCARDVVSPKLTTVDPSVGRQAEASPNHIHAAPRPLMRNGYLVRSTRAVALLGTVDRILRLCLPRSEAAAPREPRRILVSNWAHIGDVIVSLPALRALRERFPDAKIDVVVARGSRVALEGSGLYDRLYCIDHFVLNRSNRSRWSKIKTYLEDRRQFLAAARLEQYDVGIDLYAHFPPASPLFRQIGIPIRCGFTSGGFGPLLTHPVDWSYRERPITQLSGDLIEALWPDLAQAIGRLAPHHPPGPRPTLPDDLVPPDPRYVVVHIGTGARAREWPEARWCSLIEMWGADAPLLVFCGTGPREAERARRIAEHSPSGRTMLFLDRKWEEFVALVAGAAGLICLESSAGHVGARFLIPTVAIYTGINEHRLWGPDNPNARTLSAPTGCAPCHRSDCESMACVRGVTPEEVLKALRPAMQGVLPEPGML
jgi:ADP-heptose:LPS heptosyltransferase